MGSFGWAALVVVLVVACGGADDGSGEELIEDGTDDGVIDEEVPSAKYPGPCLVERVRVADGSVIQRDFRTYNDKRQLETLSLDRLDALGQVGNADGEIDQIETRIYDYGGKLLRQELDRGLDGVDWIRHWHRDLETGLVLDYETDTNADGQAENVWRYTYDSEDRIATLDYENYVNATVVQERFYYDPDSGFPDRVSLREYDRDNDLTVERTLAYTYEDNGNGAPRNLRIIRDQQGFSMADVTTGVTAEEVDGVVDASQEYLYDPDDGRLLEVQWNDLPDTTPQIDVRERYVYDCDESP